MGRVLYGIPIVCLLIGCGEDGVSPIPGKYGGPGISFTLSNGGAVSVDWGYVWCDCGNQEYSIESPDLGYTYLVDSVTLESLELPSKDLVLAGSWTSDDTAEGFWSYKCCATIPWTARLGNASSNPDIPCDDSFPGSVPVQHTSAGEVIHWTDPATCIDVTYSRGVESRLSDIKTAMAAWQGVDCSPICFTEPRPVETAPEVHSSDAAAEQSRQIHLTTCGSSDACLGSDHDSVLTFKQDSGKLLLAIVRLYEGQLATLAPGTITAGFGHALGFADAFGVPSVMNPIKPTVELTAADKASLCVLYGTTTFCRD